jgi:hypothetical protein
MAKKSTAAKIREFMARTPDAKPAAVAEKFNVNVQYVYVLRSLMKKAQNKFTTAVIPVPSRIMADLTQHADGSITEKVTYKHPPVRQETVTLGGDFSGVNIDLVHTGEQNKPDMVNNPPHYTNGGVETISFIEAKGLDYHLGNVVKYITRAGKKDDELQDLKKARWYLERAIAVRENPAHGLV